MKMIILCGGLGTRLREVIGEKQKTMADINGTPFLKILVDYYIKFGIKDYIFACGYKKEEIFDYFKDGKDFGLHIDYAVESEPLGTAGAIRNCLDFIDTELVYVVNGDTLYEFDINLLNKNMNYYNTDMSIATKKANEETRYGFIYYDIYDNTNGGIIKSFNEKNVASKPINKESYINGGIYLIKKSLIKEIPLEKTSLETDMIPSWLQSNKTIGFINSNSYFIDIGTKDSYQTIINERTNE